MVNLEQQYTRQLSLDFPDLPLRKVELFGQGWEHVVLRVNDSLVFRMPRGEYDTSKSPEKVDAEIGILKHLQGKLPVAIPYPKYIAPEKSYYGYEMLPGALLSEIEGTLTEGERAQVREDWVEIATAIHASVSVAYAESLKVQHFDPSQMLVRAARIKDVRVEPEIVEFATKIMDKVHAVDLSQQRMSFIHDDLHFLNILADPKTHKITGVIDWSGLIGPIDREFSVWEWNHNGDLEKVAAIYKQRTAVSVDVQQARLWKHLEEISDFVEQREAGDLEGAQLSLKHIERWISEGI